jgi:hypothetical protein
MNLGCLQGNAGAGVTHFQLTGGGQLERPSHARPAGIYNEKEGSLSSITFAPALIYSGVRPMA